MSKDVAAYDRIAGRMADTYADAAKVGQVGADEGAHPDLVRDPWQPRWRIDAGWIEFECGCRAERCPFPGDDVDMGDPIIFAGLPEQAVYDFVCDRHAPGMNVHVRFGRFATFDQWRRNRKHLLMGRTTA